MQIKNLDKNIEIIDYTSFFKRLKGLMFIKKPINKGIRFKKCSSIHTMFMYQKIDVIMTDKNNRIVKLYPHLAPWKIILPNRSIYYTYELPLNSINNLKIGEILYLTNTDSSV
ncbi:MAG: DUF192 domain-containing protein [Bacilli bacterium]